MDRSGSPVLNWPIDGDSLEKPMNRGSNQVCAGILVGFSLIGQSVIGGTIFTSETKLQASDGVKGDEFGRSVAIHGNTAVVGAWRDDVGANADQGSVYVYGFNGTAWVFQQKLTASDGVAKADFGVSVAIQGDTIVVGASATKIGLKEQQGKAYVFTRNSALWTQTQVIVANDGDALDHFGNDVALDGNSMIIGASEDTIGATSFQGSAYIFVKSNNVWTQQQKIVSTDSEAGTDFSKSVAISGGTVVIGAWNGSGNSLLGQGFAYVYVLDSSTWSLQRKLAASDPNSYQGFGYDVSVSGDTILVGQRFYSPVSVFVRTGTTWTQQATLFPNDRLGDEEFGYSVALDGNRAAIGSVSKIGNKVDQGTVYVFDRVGSTWTQTEKLFAADGLGYDLLGTSVGVSGEAAIAGALLSNVGTQSDQGAAYLFQQAVTTIAPIQVSISYEPTTNQITLKWNAQPGRLYTIKGSPDLNGFPTTVKSAFDPPADIAVHTFAKPAAIRMFYRVDDAGTAP